MDSRRSISRSGAEVGGGHMTDGEVLIVLLAAGVVSWPVMVAIRSLAGGWYFLSKRYRHKGIIPASAHPFLDKRNSPPPAEKNKYYPCCMGYSALSMSNYDIFRIRADSDAIYFFEDEFLLGFLHPPLKIPFSEVTGRERFFLSGSIVKLSTGAGSRHRIWVSVKIAEWLEAQSDGTWTFSRLRA